MGAKGSPLELVLSSLYFESDIPPEMQYAEVQRVEHVLGLYEYRLRVVARDLPDFERVLRRRIMTLPGVGEVEANVLLSEEYRPGPIG